MPRVRRTRKRRTRKSTAGGGDKKPQWLTTTNNAAGNTLWYSTISEIPLLNILSGGTKVLEILKVTFARVLGTAAVNYAIGSRNLSGVLQTAWPTLTAAQDKSNFLFVPVTGNFLEVDLTDSNGNGMLYPAQQIFVNSASGTGDQIYKISFLYRIKNASMAEYIGIINQFIVTQS